MSDLPFMPLYVADYLADTTHLSTEAHGAYLLLLMVLWKSGGELPNDDKTLARIVRLSPAKWDRIKSDVLAFFETRENKIFHNRITQEIQKAKNIGNKRSEIGKQGAEAKALKRLDAPLAIACDLLAENEEKDKQTASKPQASYTSDIIKVDDHSSAGGRNSFAELERKLREAAGWQNEPAPKLCVVGAIISMIDAGADLEMDVLPTVKSLAHKSNSRTSWNYFTPAIAQARDDRVRASQIVSPERNSHDSHSNRKQPRSLTDEVFAAMQPGDSQGNEAFG